MPYQPEETLLFLFASRESTFAYFLLLFVFGPTSGRRSCGYCPSPTVARSLKPQRIEPMLGKASQVSHRLPNRPEFPACCRKVHVKARGSSRSSYALLSAEVQHGADVRGQLSRVQDDFELQRRDDSDAPLRRQVGRRPAAQVCTRPNSEGTDTSFS